MTNGLTQDTATSQITGERVRHVAGIVLVLAGPGLVVGELFTSIVVTMGPLHANPAILALGYLIAIAGWLVLPGAIRTRLGSAGIAVAALLIGANSVPDHEFRGLDSTIQLAGLAGTALGAGPVGAVALALAVTLMLLAWLRVRGRVGLAYLALVPAFLVQLVFGLLIAAWISGPFAAARWPIMLGTSFLSSPLPLPVAAALGAVLGWLLLLGGSAWLAVALERAAARARLAHETTQRSTAVPPAESGVPTIVPTNPLAILALVFAFVFSPLGVVFGHAARRQIRRTGEAGYGLATAGMIIGYVQISFAVLAAVAYVVILTVTLSSFR